MVKKQSVPCYVRNGGVHNIVNVPFGQFTRLALRKLVQQLLKSAQTFETMFVVEVTEANVKILKALDEILSLNLKPKENRRNAVLLTTAHEKNLKPTARRHGNEEEINLVSLALSCGLLVILFLLAAHVQYLESFGY